MEKILGSDSEESPRITPIPVASTPRFSGENVLSIANPSSGDSPFRRERSQSSDAGRARAISLNVFDEDLPWGSDASEEKSPRLRGLSPREDRATGTQKPDVLDLDNAGEPVGQERALEHPQTQQQKILELDPSKCIKVKITLKDSTRTDHKSTNGDKRVCLTPLVDWDRQTIIQTRRKGHRTMRSAYSPVN